MKESPSFPHWANQREALFWSEPMEGRRIDNTEPDTKKADSGDFCPSSRRRREDGRCGLVTDSRIFGDSEWILFLLLLNLLLMLYQGSLALPLEVSPC